MTLHLYRSHHVEYLVQQLEVALRSRRPDNPFLSLPIAVGSRGMDRWIRHQIATHLGVAAGIDFPFPRAAFSGAVRWLLDDDRDPVAPFWDPRYWTVRERSAQTDGADPWTRDALTLRLLPLLRAHLHDDDFSLVRHYLHDVPTADAAQETDTPVDRRELTFVRAVADVIDSLLHEIPETLTLWAGEPHASHVPQEHRWLAVLANDLGVADDEQSPAVQLHKLTELSSPPTSRWLGVFGMSTLGPGDRKTLTALGKHMDVDVFLLSPSPEFYDDMVRRRKNETAAEIMDRELSDNPVIASLGRASADLLLWIAEMGDENSAEKFLGEEESAATGFKLLPRLQRWIFEANGVPSAHISCDDSIQLHATYGPLRQCEVLRDELLRLFNNDKTLHPKDVLVMTPSVEDYAPLVAAVFARKGLAATLDGDVVEKSREKIGDFDAEQSSDSGTADETPPHNDGRPTLPVVPAAINDLGLRQTNIVAQVALAALELAGGRVTSQRLADFLALDPVRRRFQLEEDDMSLVLQLIADGNIRWGLDAEDKLQTYRETMAAGVTGVHHKRDANSVRFGVERAALGVLMPDDDPMAVVTEGATDDGALSPVVPLEIGAKEAQRVVGVMALVERRIAWLRENLWGPLTVQQWCDRLIDALDLLAETTDKATWLRTQVNDELAALAKAAADGDEQQRDVMLTRDAFASWLQGRFDNAQHGDRVVTGAVTVSSLEPMRAVPFRVVVLLGMDDGMFPRNPVRPAWDPFAKEDMNGPLPRRDVDRHLLLEAILSARDTMMILWTGRDMKTNEALAAAVPVEDLIETLQRVTGEAREKLVQEHPLQPWSEGAFGQEERSRSFDGTWLGAAKRVQAIRRGGEAERRGLAGAFEEPLGPEKMPPTEVNLRTFVSGLYSPYKALVQKRLQLYGDDETVELSEYEPLDFLPEGQAQASLKETLYDVAKKTAKLDPKALREQVVARARGEGTLPPPSLAEDKVAGVVDSALTLLGKANEALGQRQEEPIHVSVQIPGERSGDDQGGRALASKGGQADRVIHLVGELGDVGVLADGSLAVVAVSMFTKDPNNWTMLQLWVSALAARATGANVTQAVAVGETKTCTLLVPSVEACKEHLKELAKIWDRARREPLYLFKRTSPALGKLKGEPEDEGFLDNALKEVQKAWASCGNWSNCDQDDPIVTELFQGYDPVQDLRKSGVNTELISLARTIWTPLFQAEMTSGKEAKK